MFRFLFLSVFATFLSNPLLAQEFSELNRVDCFHYQSSNQDPILHLSFKTSEHMNDFIEIKTEERIRSKFFADIKWVLVDKREEQIATSAKAFNIGIGDFLLTISRPIPNWNQATHNNAIMYLESGQRVELRCEFRD